MQDKVLEILQSALNCERILRFDQRRNFLHTVEQHDRDLKRLDPKYALQFDQAIQELRVFLDDSWENINSAIERIIGVQREARAKEIRPIKHSTLNGEKPSIELLSQALRLPSITTISSASHSILPAEAYAAFMASIDAATARSLHTTPSSTKWRARMPVRSTIQSSEVSTPRAASKPTRSSFDRRRGGR